MSIKNSLMLTSFTMRKKILTFTSYQTSYHTHAHTQKYTFKKKMNKRFTMTIQNGMLRVTQQCNKRL